METKMKHRFLCFLKLISYVYDHKVGIMYTNLYALKLNLMK
jgi:hypothetical protein